MKKLLTIVILLITINCQAQSRKKLDEKNGFKDAIFGMDISEFKDTVKLSEYLGVSAYMRTTDEMKLGDFTLNSITYSFCNKKLCSILIETEGRKNCEGVLEVLESTCGYGWRVNSFLSEYYWYGEIVTMRYCFSADYQGTITISNKKLLRLHKKKPAKDAANSL